MELAFTLDAVSASVKGLEVLADHEQVYVRSRVLTDIRPIFDEDATAPLLGSLVINTLKLTIRTDGHISGLCVALDIEDLKELRGVIDRAILKSSEMGIRLRDQTQAFGRLIDQDFEDE